MKVMLRSLLALSLLFAGCGAAFAAAGTLYIDTGGSANNSGSTNYSNNIYSGTAGSITIVTTTTAGTFSGASVTLTTNGCANAGNPAAGAAVYDTTNSSYIGLVATCSGVTLTVGNTNVLNGPSHAVGNGDALYFAGPTITLDTATNFGISKTASGSFTTASATITITGASCTGINNGMGIYDSTASAVVGVVNSCSLGVITLGTAAGATANSKTNSSGSSDTILFGLPGCVGTGGTCDGTQSISLTNNSTNICHLFNERHLKPTAGIKEALVNHPCHLHETDWRDGSARSWKGERVYCNPPYGAVAKWLMKAREAEAAVFLLPARTDTKWWHEYAMQADEIRFIRGRLKFGGAKFNAPFPSVVLIYGRIP